MASILAILCRFHIKFANIASIGIDCAILSQAGGLFEWQGRLAIVGALLALTFATFWLSELCPLRKGPDDYSAQQLNMI